MPSCPNKISLKYNLAQHFAANRASKSAREAELCQICQGDPQRAFSEILQSWEQVKLLQKKARENTLARMPSCPNYNFLEVPT